MLQKNPKESFGQPNIIFISSFISLPLEYELPEERDFDCLLSYPQELAHYRCSIDVC